MIIRAFLILFSVFVLSSTDASAELQQRPIAELVEAARQAKERQDDKKFDEITGQIYERITGADFSAPEIPEGATPAEFDERLCTYRKVISPLFTQSQIELLRHSWRIISYGMAPETTESTLFRALLSCTYDNGEPVLEAKAARDGLSWAKKLNEANLEEAREMAREYRVLFEKYPDDEIYISLADIIRKVIEEGLLEKPAGGVSDEELQFQWDLVQSAREGDLSAQMELAQRLEAGDRFIQGNAKAYFWYKRALQNGGGQPAQTAMERLHPRLSEFDLALVDYWTKFKSDPY